MFRTFALGVVIVATVSATVSADSIVIEGRQYNDVLVYESDRFYFVKIPQIGEVVSVAKDSGKASDPEINNNLLYRQELRKIYTDVKEGNRPPARAASDSAFQIEENDSAVDVDTAALLSGGGANAKPMNLSVEDAKAAFTPLGVTFTGSGDSITGKSGDGVVDVTIKSQGGQVTYISGSINSTDPAAIQQKAMGVVGMISKLAPWANAWIMQNVQTLMGGGTLQKTQDGVGISIGATASGMQFTVAGA